MQMQAEKRPYFTIVIPTYNRAKLIQKTLDSVQEQIFKDFEVIIIDDCSTDNTLAVLANYLEDPRISLIVNPSNYERAKSRNIGLKHAKGKFLTFLDSDDFMYPNNLLDAYNFTQENPEYHFFRNLYELVDDEKRPVGSYDAPPSKQKEIEVLSMGNFISCIGVFISSKIYKQYFFDENKAMLVSEDWEYWLRIRPVFELGTIHKVNSGILSHPNRSMNNFDPEEIFNRKMLIINKTLQSPETQRVYSEFEKAMKFSVYLFVAIQANAAGARRMALKYLGLGLSYYPLGLFHKRTLIVLYNSILKY